jgi:thiosulfate/3-mercaptopyruvate sulfurtransferase
MEYAHPEYLVGTDWLAQRLDDPGVRIFDVTPMLTADFQNVGREKGYEMGHIPGAQYLDVASPKGDLSATESILPWSWPSQEQFEALMGRLGVDNETQVIIYAGSLRPGIDNGLMWSTRAWWVMHNFGVRCALLNGGLEKWVAEGRPVSTEAASHEPTEFSADPDWRDGLATKEHVLQALGSPDEWRVIDSLSPESYGGTAESSYGPRKGHISGAINIPMRSLYDMETGLFASADALHAKFEEAGVLDKENVITYCGAGIAATGDAFALALLGHEGVAVYDNSLMEWTADPSMPMVDPNTNSDESSAGAA